MSNHEKVVLHIIVSSQSSTFNKGVLFVNADNLQLLSRPQDVTRRVTFSSSLPNPCNLSRIIVVVLIL